MITSKLETLGSKKPSDKGGSFEERPAEEILVAAVAYIGALEEQIKKLREEIEDVRKIHECCLNDLADYRAQLQAYKLVKELNDKYPPGLYDQSEGVTYLTKLLYK